MATYFVSDGRIKAVEADSEQAALLVAREAFHDDPPGTRDIDVVDIDDVETNHPDDHPEDRSE